MKTFSKMSIISLILAFAMFFSFLSTKVFAEGEYFGIAIGTSKGGSYSTGFETDITGSMNISFNIGETITLKATPDEGYVFKGWYKGIIGDSHFVESYDSDTLISTNANYSFTATNDAPSTFYAVFEENSSPKAVFIDNTVDKSKSYITGVIEIKDNRTGETTTETVYSEEIAVTYSNPRTEAVQNAINSAYDIAYNKVEGYSNINISTSEIAGDVWDNRKYEAIQGGDAILIGDADYLEGAYGVSSEYTNTFIASGDYGKNTYYVVTATAEYTSEEEYQILDGANGEYTIDSNTDLIVRANGNIDNFVELKVDGETLAEENYTVESGSIIAILKSSYLNTLSSGDHTLTFVYNDGEVSTNFKIAKTNESVKTKSSSPKTGDSIMLWVAAMILSVLGLQTVTKHYSKRN